MENFPQDIQALSQKMNEDQEVVTSAFKDKVLDLSVNGIYVYDIISGNNIYINKQYTNLTGFTLEDLNAMSQNEFFALFHPEDQASIAAHMEEVLSSEYGEIVEIEYRFKRVDGSWMWCLSRDSVFEVDQEQKATKFMGTFIDVTAKKEAEALLMESNTRLARVNQQLQHFTNIASHDLQEPLRTISNYSGLLKEEYHDKLDEDGNMFIDAIHESTTRMRDMVIHLMDYSMIGHNSRPTEIDCNNLLQTVLHDLKMMVGDFDARIYSVDLPRIKGYKIELHSLLQNLISNAIKFHRAGSSPSIHVEAKDKGQFWEFSIRDNGIGIPEKYQQKIFDLFKRLNPIEEYPGLGIGLAHCKKIVDLHGGEIWVESSASSGSTFYFTIPQN